jgi:hypothetical protein
VEIGGIMNGYFTTSYYPIKLNSINDECNLIPFGDIHRDAQLCDSDKWLSFIEWARRKKDNYYLGMGDYSDFLSTSERKHLNQAGLHESTSKTIDDLILSQTNRFYNEIKFMKGRLIGLLEGNHYGVLQNGTTTTQYLCSLLGCKYLGISSFVRLGFSLGNKRASVDIWANHGKGASRMVGGSLNTVQQMTEVAEADVFLMGHDHKKSIATKTKLVLTGNGDNITLNHKKILFGRTGSFLVGYKSDVDSYVAGRCLPPTDLGVLRIYMKPKRERIRENGETVYESFYIDLHGSI